MVEYLSMHQPVLMVSLPLEGGRWHCGRTSRKVSFVNHTICSPKVRDLPVWERAAINSLATIPNRLGLIPNMAVSNRGSESCCTCLRCKFNKLGTY